MLKLFLIFIYDGCITQTPLSPRLKSCYFAYFLEWPDLDVDLEIESLQHPKRYPLVIKRNALDFAMGAKVPDPIAPGA